MFLNDRNSRISHILFAQNISPSSKILEGPAHVIPGKFDQTDE
jgi:hypothetical protein